MISASTKLPKKEPKPGFLCPITQDLMLDPVLLTSSGHTYERDAIEAWLEKKGTDPQTRATASVQQLIPNRALKETIDHWLKKYPQSSEAELWTAVKANDKKALERCVLLGVNLAATDKYGDTPLHYAAENGHTDIAKYLVDKGASVAAKNNIGNTSLHLAVKEGHTELAKYLIDKKAPLDGKTKTFGQTPLHWAAQRGHTEIAKYLINKGAPLEVKDKEDTTPLHCAAGQGYIEIAKHLVDNDASLDAKDNRGETPLHWAADKGQTEMVKYLIDKGASLEAKDKDDRTPLHLAASYGLTDTVKYLVDNGASVDAKTKYGHTPLHLAAEKNRTEIAKYLVYMAADRAAKDNNGQTPQQVANATLAQAMDSWPVVTALPASRLTAELFVLKTKLVEKNELLVNQTQQLTVQFEQVASLSSQLELLLAWKKEVEQQLPTSTHSVTFFSNKTQTNNKGKRSHHEEASSRSLHRNV